MRVAVIGAGAVGGTMAARLFAAGHSVEVAARGNHLAAIRADGIRLRGAWGDIDAMVDANPTITVAPQLTILATKAQDAAAALTSNLPALGTSPILVVQNGLESVSAARSIAHNSPIAGGLAMFAASYFDAGTITVTATGPTYVGEDRVLARRIDAELGAALDLVVVDNFEGAQWTKLVVNQINALPAITGLSAQAVLADRHLRLMVTEAMRETVRVGAARGIHFASLSGLTPSRLRLLAALPAVAGQVVPLVMRRRMGHVPNPGSTLQSIARGQLSEIDYLSGAVVRAAHELGLAAPVNARFVELVHRVERQGSFLRL